MEIILQFFKENILDYLLRPIILDVIQTPQILASLQFAFTSMLTFFIPLLVILFEKRDEFNSLDKKLIEKISKIRFILLAILTFLATSVLLPQISWLSIAIYIIIFGFLGYQTLAIINFILNRDKYRQKEILNSTDEETLDYFEEFFLGGNSKIGNGISTRNYQKVFSKEQLMIELFSQNLDKKFNNFKKLKHEEMLFVEEMLQTLITGLESIDMVNLVSHKLHKSKHSTLLENIIRWHYKAWLIAIQKEPNITNQRDFIEQNLATLVQNIFVINKNSAYHNEDIYFEKDNDKLKLFLNKITLESTQEYVEYLAKYTLN